MSLCDRGSDPLLSRTHTLSRRGTLSPIPDRSLSFLKREGAPLLLLLLFRALLDLSYVEYVHRIYEHKGFLLSGWPSKVAVSYAVLFLVHFWLPRDQSRFSNLGLQVLFVVGFVPISSFFGWGQGDWIWFLACSTFFMLLCGVTRILSREVKLPTPPKKKKLTEYDLAAILLVIPLTILLLLAYFKGLLFNLDLSVVYAIREEFVEVQNKVPFGGYFMHWGVRVIMPFLFLISIYGRRGIRPGLFFFSLLLLIVLFSVTGHKSYLFLPVMAVGASLLVRNGHFFRDLLTVCILLVVTCMLHYLCTGGNFPMLVFVKRVFFIPAKLSWFYHDHFQGEFLYLSHSIFKGITSYPLDQNHTELIAQTYMGIESHANNGIFSDGLKNFGIFGMYLWAFLVAGLLKLCDLLSARKRAVVLWPFMLTGIYSLVNAQLFPLMLTHGFLVSLILVFSYPIKFDHDP